MTKWLSYLFFGPRWDQLPAYSKPDIRAERAGSVNYFHRAMGRRV
jgi:hypothetical protein